MKTKITFGLLAVALGLGAIYWGDSRANEQAQKYTPLITQLGAAPDVGYPGHGLSILVPGAQTPGDVAFLEEVVYPKSIGAPAHIHQDEDEYFFVLSGEVTFLNGEETVTAGTGTLAAMPRGNWHGFWNASDEPAHMLMMVTPSNFETFFDEVAMKVRAENASTPEAIGAIIGQTAAARNITVDPARLPPEALALMP